MTVQTRAQLLSDIATLLADNSAGDISAQDVRERLVNMIDSMLFIAPRANTVASSATPTINTDTTDIARITALATNVTNFSTNLSGTPTHDQKLIIEITGTATRTLAWGTSFESSTIALPTTTVGTAMLAVGLMWNSATSKWRCMAVA